jgi:PAS domain S-box-containing protein
MILNQIPLFGDLAFIQPERIIDGTLYVAAIVIAVFVLLTFLFVIKKTKKNNAEENSEIEALKWDRNKYQAIIDNLSDSVIIIDKEGLICDVNKQAGTLFGINGYELIGKNTEKASNELGTGFIECIQSLLKNKEKKQTVCSLRLKNGTTKKLSVSFLADILKEYSVFIINDLTELEQLEDKENERQHRYKEVFDYASEGLYVINVTKENRFVFSEINHKVELMTGITNEQIRGKYVDEILAPETAALILTHYQSCIDRGKDTSFEETYKLNNGIRELKTTLCPVKDEYGRVIRIIGVFVDLTEEKNNEKFVKKVNDELERRFIQKTNELKAASKVIQEKEQRLELAFSGAGYGWWDWDYSTGRIILHSSIYTMLGYSREEISTDIKWWLRLIHPDDLGMVFKKMKSHLKNEIPIFNVGHRLKCKDGNWLWVLNHARMFELDEFNKPLSVLGTIQNIHEKKVTEEQMEKLAMIVERSNSSMAIGDADGNLIWVNGAFTKMNGYTLEEVAGKKAGHILQGVGTDQEVVKKIGKAIKDKEEVRVEILNYKKSGEGYWVDLNIQPVFDEKGTLINYIAMHDNITERKRLIKEIEFAKDAAETANKAKSEFLANMSHEIRTPMNAIIGFSDLLYNSIENKKQKSQIDSIRTSSKNLLRIINDILDLSKIEAGKMQMLYEPVNLRASVKEIENMFMLKIKEKKLEFVLEYDESIPQTVIIDEIRLRQILFNLIGNSVKFTESGLVKLAIRKKENSESKDKIDLQIFVEDTGIGLPEEKQNTVFEAFNQQLGFNAKKYGGTGLGLPITKRLIDIMGGTISFISKANIGTAFEINLPGIEVSSERTEKESKIDFNPYSVAFEKAKILICDDNLENRKLIIDILEFSPLTLFEAENGLEAVELATKKIPDLILMDLKMPELNGFDATRMIKSQELTKGIPVIAISASLVFLMEDAHAKELFDDFLLKPVNISELLETMKKYLKYSVFDSTKSSFDAGNILTKELTEHEQLVLPELLKELEGEFTLKYNDVVQNNVIDDIKEFGNEVAALGQKYTFADIKIFGEDIVTFADNFDVERLLKTLSLFPSVIQGMKSKIK